MKLKKKIFKNVNYNNFDDEKKKNYIRYEYHTEVIFFLLVNQETFLILIIEIT